MSMKVILKSEVHNLGLPGDVVTVADGYGRNYLIPQGFAIRATDGAMKEAEALTRSRLAQEAKTLGDAEKQKELIESRTLQIKARVDDAGHLYGSVAVGDVQKVLKERGFTVDKRRIELKGSIKQIGEYQIPIQVHPQVLATVTLDVVDVEGKVGVAVEVDDLEGTGLEGTDLEGAALEGTGIEAPEGVDATSIEEAALAAAAELEAEEAPSAQDEPAADEAAVAEAPSDEPAAQAAPADEAAATETEDEEQAAEA